VILGALRVLERQVPFYPIRSLFLGEVGETRIFRHRNMTQVDSCGQMGRIIFGIGRIFAGFHRVGGRLSCLRAEFEGVTGPALDRSFSGWHLGWHGADVSDKQNVSNSPHLMTKANTYRNSHPKKHPWSGVGGL
jgi:hypothetical protein